MKLPLSALARWRPNLHHQPRQALLAAAALLLAAGGLMPVLSWQRARVNQVVVIDITQSMSVLDQSIDAPPNGPTEATAAAGLQSRLAGAKQALRHALDTLPCGSKLGWAVFTEHRSYLLLMPLEVCEHRAELRDTLAGISGAMAWSGDSEIAKGLHSALDIAHKVPGGASLVFVTDGHESPPINARHRPRFDDKPGDVAGLIVGVGGPTPQAIPKTDLSGRSMGFWQAAEVLQTDPRSQGRGASVSGEKMVDDEAAGTGGSGAAGIGLGATPGAEHLSSLREPYLQLLASENGLGYHRLRRRDDLALAMRAPAMTQPVKVPVQGRHLLGLLALGLLLLRCGLSRQATRQATRHATGHERGARGG